MQLEENGTEQSLARWVGMDQWEASQLSDELIESHLSAVSCVKHIKDELARIGEAISHRLAAGRGRLIYCGAGSAGGQACLDGLELPSTFGWPQSRLALLLAGGVESFYDQGGLSEDNTDLAQTDVQNLGVTPDDVLIAVSASGNTPYTTTAVQHARAQGALTLAVVNNQSSLMQSAAEMKLVLSSGAEAIAGSTRMAAATAQKIALNTLSTLVMTRLGFVYDNLMVRMRVSNSKLQIRALSIVCQISGCEESVATRALDQAQQDVPLAVLLAKGWPMVLAREKLLQCSGNLRSALAAE